MTGMHATYIKVLDTICSCCAARGETSLLWLVRAGLYSMSFCPFCDGRAGT